MAVPGAARAFAVLCNGAGCAVAMLDTRRLRLLRAVTVDRLSFPGPGPLAADHIFAVSNSGLSLLDAHTGRLLRTVAGLSGTPVVDARRGLAYASRGAALAVLDARRGTLLRTIPLGRDYASPAAVDVRTGQVFVLSAGPSDTDGVPLGRGWVAVMDGPGGRLLGRVAVGVGPDAVGVDEQTGHVFVLNRGGAIRVPDPWGWVPSRLRAWLPFLPAPSTGTQVTSGSVSLLDLTPWEGNATGGLRAHIDRERTLPDSSGPWSSARPASVR
jgi:hypothetical protein